MSRRVEGTNKGCIIGSMHLCVNLATLFVQVCTCLIQLVVIVVLASSFNAKVPLCFYIVNNTLYCDRIISVST